MVTPRIDTPAWIGRIMAANDGGWFVPLKLSEDHPLVAEGWSCMHCMGGFTKRHVGLVMPFEDKWVATHRSCIMKAMGLPPIEPEPIEPEPVKRQPVRVRYFDDHLEPLPWTECRKRWHTHTGFGGSKFAHLLTLLDRIEPMPEEIKDVVFPAPADQGPDGLGVIEPHHEMYDRYDPNDTQAHEETYYTVLHPEHGLFLLMTVGGAYGLPDRVVWADVGYDRYIELAELYGVREGPPPSEHVENVDDLFDELV